MYLLGNKAKYRSIRGDVLEWLEYYPDYIDAIDAIEERFLDLERTKSKQWVPRACNKEVIRDLYRMPFTQCVFWRRLILIKCSLWAAIKDINQEAFSVTTVEGERVRGYPLACYHTIHQLALPKDYIDQLMGDIRKTDEFKRFYFFWYEGDQLDVTFYELINRINISTTALYID